MMEFELKNSERMLFALLRASLHDKDIDDIQPFYKATSNDWKQCYELAVQQGVLALAWDKILTLSDEMKPERLLRLKWGMSVDRIEAKYERYCDAIAELSTFYSEHDIVTVQMKGVGLSSYYPIPAHREGGDIDIFTYSASIDKMSDKEANKLADFLMQERGIDVDIDHSPKHSNFYYKGIPIENHKTFLNVGRYKIALQVETMLRNNMNPEPTELLGGKYKILTPSPDFNTLFLAFHAAQHYGDGLAVHHLCDWAMLISRYGLQLPKDLKDRYFLNGISAYTQLCNHLLGTSVPIDGGEKLAHEMLKEILYPKYDTKNIPVKGKLNIFIYKAKRFLYTARISNTILYMPYWKRILHSIIYHFRRPETIFQTVRK